MPSQIAWLDASSEEQRRMRDIIQMFTDREARDELGIGTIRDALGDMLFPGSSTLHTRARYLLFVPWIYTQAAHTHHPVREAERLERRLVTAFADAEDSDGLLGSRAGAGLKTLPSQIYWAALGTYGIRHDAGATRESTLLTNETEVMESDDAVRTQGTWHGRIPVPPAGFPTAVPSGFTLTREEAEWLRDRMITAAPGTLLEYFIHHPPEEEAAFPWEDAAAQGVTGALRSQLGHARAFSAVIHGAQLLYNLMLAERYEAAGFEGHEDLVEEYESRLAGWAHELPNEVPIDTWDVHELITLADAQRSRPVPGQTQRFVHNWTGLVREHFSRQDPVSSLTRSSAAWELIARREKETKRQHGRLLSDKRLSSWGGASGAARLNFRWSYVQRILEDLHNGLNEPGSH
ncbi:DUF6361 family protein [Dietzia sp. NPDC055877]